MGVEGQFKRRNTEDVELLQAKLLDRPLPVLFSKKEDCCGCAACYSICSVASKGAINMKEDDEGFLYPVLDENMCIRCYSCVNVCPIKMEERKSNDEY